MNGAVTVVGSINVDRTLRVADIPGPDETVLGPDLTVSCGGKGANQAVAAARAGARVRMIGRVGDDADGRAQLDALRHSGVDVSDVTVTPTRRPESRTSPWTSPARTESSFIPVPTPRSPEADIDAAADTIRSAAVLVLQLEFPLATVARAAQIASAARVRILLNVSPAADLPAELLDAADPVRVNEHEHAVLTEMRHSACVTLGADGASWGKHTVTSHTVRVLDSTGAGDAFAGALAAAFAERHDNAAALRAAVEAGTAACTWHGARATDARAGARSDEIQSLRRRHGRCDRASS